MLISRAEVDGDLLPKTLAPAVRRLLQTPTPNELQLVVRALYHHLQDRTDQWLQANVWQPRPADDTRDAGDTDANSSAAGDAGDAGDTDPLFTDPQAAADYAYVTALNMKAFENAKAGGTGEIEIDEADQITDNDLYRLYQARFDFTASDLLAEVRLQLDFIGRTDLIDLLTPTVIGHRLHALGVPYHRTNQRRRYTLSYPVLIPLIQQHGSLLPDFSNYPAGYFQL